MDKKWIYLLLVLCLGLVTSKDTSLISITCENQSDCKVEDQELAVKDGAEIKLKFNIMGMTKKENPRPFASMNLKYNNTPLLTAYTWKTTVAKHPMYFTYTRFTNVTFTTDGGNFLLQLTFTNLTMQKDNRKMFEYKLDYNGEGDNGHLNMNVRGGPTPCGSIKLKESYNVTKDGDNDIDFMLCGNPAPAVSANIDGTVYGRVKRIQTDDYEYMYTVSLPSLTPDKCGHELSITAEGDDTFGRQLPLSTKMNVIFTPPKVENIYPYLHLNNCIVVTWNAVEAGSCEVTYNVKYEPNGTVENFSLTQTLWKLICNASGSDTVTVRAYVNGKYGDFNTPVKPSRSPPPVPPTTPTTPNPSATAEKSKRTEGAMEWKYILAIVVGVIALILITAVIVIAVRRKDKASNNNNEGGRVEMLNTGNQDVENDYADVNTLSTLIRPPVNKSSLDDQQLVYAELGPGGGRLGPKHIPEESNYAQVRTEGVHYPELQQSSYRDKPHSYSVATRTKSTDSRSSSRPPDKDDYDDYDEDIIV